MVNSAPTPLSRRESQIMNIVYRLGEASANEIAERLPDPPGNSSIRSILSILEEKGHLTHRRARGRFIYIPSVPSETVQRSALQQLIQTFFSGSAPRMVAKLLSTSDLTQDELDEIAQLIEEAKQEDHSHESSTDAE